MVAFWLILFKINLIFGEYLPWDRWVIDNNTPGSKIPRRHAIGKVDNTPYKAPNFNCECPPNEECKLDFKIDDQALDFLKLRGLLKKHEEAQLKNLVLSEKRKSYRKHMYNRRAYGDVPEEQCCCPPKHLANT